MFFSQLGLAQLIPIKYLLTERITWESEMIFLLTKFPS